MLSMSPFESWATVFAVLGTLVYVAWSLVPPEEHEGENKSQSAKSEHGRSRTPSPAENAGTPGDRELAPVLSLAAHKDSRAPLRAIHIDRETVPAAEGDRR
jgi:Na+-transporting methylmalonyl-CoA/oxaloacetate decarboxylase gamma subunit